MVFFPSLLSGTFFASVIVFSPSDKRDRADCLRTERDVHHILLGKRPSPCKNFCGLSPMTSIIRLDGRQAEKVLPQSDRVPISGEESVSSTGEQAHGILVHKRHLWHSPTHHASDQPHCTESLLADSIKMISEKAAIRATQSFRLLEAQKCHHLGYHVARKADHPVEANFGANIRY